MRTKHCSLRLIAALTAAVPLVVSAGVSTLKLPEKAGVPVHWWPILPDLPGWVHDEAASRRYDSNFLVPRGQTFAEAPAVIYARALYKSRLPDTKSVEQLIAEDERRVAKDSPGVRISEQAALQDHDGRGYRCVAFAPADEGTWELVAYGEEDDYYLIFTLSGDSPKALEKALPDFKKLIARYKKKL
jgi:hypothetical protein